MAKIEVKNVTKTFLNAQGEERKVLAEVNLLVAAGEFVCLLGPSGCGKTTLMNLMAGFAEVSEGQLTIDGETVTGPNPKHITIFQDYGLFPWRTVVGNVLFPLEAKGMPAQEAASKAAEYLELVGLTQFADNFPVQLSGGMKQRVSIARALAVEPDILYMDEPFAALDAFTRYRLQDEVLKIWQQKQPTVIFVTHDIDEAIYLGQRVVIMNVNPGRIRKIITVEHSLPRDRTDSVLADIRHKVYQEFELIHEEIRDYSI